MISVGGYWCGFTCGKVPQFCSGHLLPIKSRHAAHASITNQYHHHTTTPLQISISLRVGFENASRKDELFCLECCSILTSLWCLPEVVTNALSTKIAIGRYISFPSSATGHLYTTCSHVFPSAPYTWIFSKFKVNTNWYCNPLKMCQNLNRFKSTINHYRTTSDLANYVSKTQTKTQDVPRRIC